MKTANERMEKAILGLECCIKRDPEDVPRCEKCPYDGACANRLKQDALSLLTLLKDGRGDDWDEKKHSGLLEEE